MQDSMFKGVAFIEKIKLEDYNKNIYDPIETIGPVCNDVSWQTIALSTMFNTTIQNVPATTPATGTPSGYWSMKFATSDFIQSPMNVGVPSDTDTRVNTNVGYPLFVPKTIPSEKDYVVFVADLLPPSSGVRTIYGIGIGTTGISSVAFNVPGAYDNSITNLRLSTPCSQDTALVIRVTYRLYIDDEATSPSETSDGYYAFVRNLFKQSSDGTYTAPRNITTYPYYHGSSFYDINTLPLSKPLTYNLDSSSYHVKLSDIGISEGANYTSTYGNVLSVDKTWSLTNTQTMGIFARSLLLYGQDSISPSVAGNVQNPQVDCPFMAQKILPAGTSPVQNIFKQTSGATGPFQDLSNLGTMTGTITLDTTFWVESAYPKLFKVIIQSSGDATSATYKVETLSFTGGFVQNSYCPRDAVLPQDGLTLNSEVYFKNNFKDAHVLDYVNLGGTTIRSPDNVKYFVAASCQRTKDGIAYYNIETGLKTVLNTASSPSLPVSNVSDMAVSNGYTFITCSTTGLWQIDPTFTTVTHLTSIGAGVDSSKAYQIDVKSNGDLWVLFEGGLCKGTTADSGATWSWSVYNTGSGFTATGITDSNWSNVTSMCVDPDHSNDRILFILGSAAATNSYAAGFIWWERSTLTTTVMTTGLAYPSFSLANNLQRSDLVRCINGYWFTTIETTVNTTRTYHMCTWSGATPPLSWTSRAIGSPLSTAPRFIPASVAGVNGALVGSAVSNSGGDRTTFPSTTLGNCSTTPAFFVNGANFSSLPATLTNQSIMEFFVKYGTVDTMTTALESAKTYTYYNGSCPQVYLTNSNMVVYWNDFAGKFSVSPIIPRSTVANYSTYKPAAWKSYGWDGSAWVLGHVGAKTCSTSPSVFFDGMNITFSNGGTAPHFVAGESFVFVVGNGLMKDNATDYTFKYNVYPCETEKVTDFYDFNNGQVTVVPSVASGQLTNDYVNFNIPTLTYASSMTSQKKGYFNGHVLDDGDYHVGNCYVGANSPFTYKFKLTTTPRAASSRTVYIFEYGGSWASASSTPRVADNADGTVSFKNLTVTYATFTPTTINHEYSLVRGVDNIIRFYVDGVLYGSTNQNNTIQRGISAPVITNIDNRPSYGGIYDSKITYYEPRRLLRVGNSTTLTGYFNDKFIGLTNSHLANDGNITINGVQQTLTVNTSGPQVTTAPNVKVLPSSGLLEFIRLPVITVTTTSGVTNYAAVAAYPVMSTTKSVNKTVIVVNGGTGYTNGTYPMVFTGGGGTGAVGTITISGGIVTAATVTNGGSGYTSAPTISIGGSPGTPTTAAIFSANIGYSITGVTFQNYGSGLGNTQTVSITAPTGIGGHTATATVTMSATRSLHTVVSLSNSGGAGYTDGVYPLTITGGAGSGAAGNVHISGGKVVWVEITNAGSGYTSAPTLSFTGAGTPTTVCALTGAIGYVATGITITDGGSGYIPDGALPISGYLTSHYHY